MAVKKPLVIGSNGLPQQLQAGDSIASPTAGVDLVSQVNGEAGAVVIGAPVYQFAAGSIKKGQANAAGTADILGLMYDVTTASAGTGSVATNGLLVATTTQWDAVAGTTGGLAFGVKYFLDPATAGKITSVPPTTAGQLVVLLGTAMSTTDFMIDIQAEILL
jgi:hypothetical protein